MFIFPTSFLATMTSASSAPASPAVSSPAAPLFLLLEVAEKPESAQTMCIVRIFEGKHISYTNMAGEKERVPIHTREECGKLEERYRADVLCWSFSRIVSVNLTCTKLNSY